MAADCRDSLAEPAGLHVDRCSLEWSTRCATWVGVAQARGVDALRTFNEHVIRPLAYSDLEGKPCDWEKLSATSTKAARQAPLAGVRRQPAAAPPAPVRPAQNGLTSHLPWS
jgi:hypothetical protein